MSANPILLILYIFGLIGIPIIVPDTAYILYKTVPTLITDNEILLLSTKI